MLTEVQNGVNDQNVAAFKHSNANTALQEIVPKTN